MINIDFLQVLDSKKQETYSCTVNCLNCGRQYGATIPKGLTINEYNPECPNCGVSHLKMAKEFGNI